MSFTLCEYKNDGRQQTSTEDSPVEDKDIIEATCSEDSGGVAALWAADRWRWGLVPCWYCLLHTYGLFYTSYTSLLSLYAYYLVFVLYCT